VGGGGNVDTGIWGADGCCAWELGAWKMAGTDARWARFGRRDRDGKGWKRAGWYDCGPCTPTPPEAPNRLVGRPDISIPSEIEARMYGAACGGDRPGGGPEGGG